MKSILNLIYRATSEERFCAFCKSSRRVPERKHAGLLNFVGTGIFSAVLMFVVWGRWDPRAMIFFICFLGLTEIAIQIRWRLSLVCQKCGFDPILYMKNAKAACSKVKTHLDKIQERPLGHLMMPDLPRRKLPEGEKMPVPATEEVSEGDLAESLEKQLAEQELIEELTVSEVGKEPVSNI